MDANRRINEIINSTSGWNEFFVIANTLTNQEKGALFEKLTHLIFKTKSIYKSTYKNVWLLSEGIDPKIKKKLNLPNSDEGIDLIAETRTGSYCAIQCKFKGANESPTRKDIATFLDLSRNHCKNINKQILVHTGTNGIKKTSLLPDSFTQIGLEVWSTLNNEDWKNIRNAIKNRANRPIKRNPRKHQSEAIDASVNYFVKAGNKRGKLIMPCGTGKSLTAYWIAESLKSKSTIVAVPSLALIKQTLDDWTKEMIITRSSNLPDWICICSDESTGKLTDDFVVDTFSLGIHTTTNTAEIESFLKSKSKGGKVIFTTYQSAKKLAEVSKKVKYRFDLAILDEAHKTVGNTDKSFSTLLKNNAIDIDKRLFMTATEKVVKGAAEDVLSMNDTNVYGNVFYQLSFKKAIEQNIITNYNIVTVLVNDYEVNELISKNKYLSDKKKRVNQAEAQTLTTALALRKAKAEFGISHTVSFHKSISAAKEFQSLFQKIDTGKNKSEVYHISSKINAGNRAALLNAFRESEKAVITNARCLTEGVDVPSIDCVLFADEKHSIIDIVQASGRALRQFTNTATGKKKELGYIIIPIIQKSGENFEDLTTSDRFKTVIRVVASLSTQDETIAEELKLIDAGIQKVGSGKIQVIGTVGKSLNLSIHDLSKKVSIKIWGKVAKVNWQDFFVARNYSRSLKLSGYSEWLELVANGHIPKDIPVYPDKTYYGRGWVSWPDWLGNLSTEDKFNEGLFQLKKYIKTYGNSYVPEDHITADGFKLGQFSKMARQGTIVVQDRLDALNNINGWVWDIEADKFKKLYTALRDFSIKNKGVPTRGISNKKVTIGKTVLDLGIWVFTLRNLYKNLENGKIKPTVNKRLLKSLEDPRIKLIESIPYWEWSVKKKMITFDQARRYIKKLKLHSRKEYCHWWDNNASKLNFDLPKKPEISYAESGWKNWQDFLGSSLLSNWDKSKNKFSYSQAKQFMKVDCKGLITSMAMFNKWAKNLIKGIPPKPIQMPNAPWLAYSKDPSWKGVGDFLGTGRTASRDVKYLSYKKAKEFLKKYSFNKRDDYFKWYDKNNKYLIKKNIILPKYCHQTYHSEWQGWNIFLGNNNRHGKKNIPWMPFKKARAFVRKLKLINLNEWYKYCRGELKGHPPPPYNIPVFPHRNYKNDGFISYLDWLGK